MDRALLEQALVFGDVTPAASLDEIARLRALDSQSYWLEMARELVWDRAPTTALEGHLGHFRYFPGAHGNVSVNCLDRWPKERVALRYEREDGLRETWTYGELTDAVARFAAALQDLGVEKGDRVALYASNVPEAYITIHACYRIGALYSVVFAGFSASAVRDRLADAKPKVVVCTDATLRRGRVVPLKATLDEAIAKLGDLDVPHVIVARRVDRDHALRAGEHDFATLLASTQRAAPPLSIEANEAGFIIYTSGTTAKPKGLVHAGIGFLVGVYANVKWSLALTATDSYWCTADVGWLTCPIFAVVGGLAHGATLVVYEGSLDTPTPARAYEIMERYRVNKVFTAPTALRMMRRAGDALLRDRELGLDLVSLVGEPLDPDTWRWARDTLGAHFINNTYGQTETGTAWSSCIVGASPTKPGSCGHALPGYEAHVLRGDGSAAEADELGALTLSAPFPSLARTVWGDHHRYIESYLERFPGHYAASDAALFDRDGQLWVTGRLDDVINVAGHRLGTMELEAALLTHAAVSEAAVVTQPDDIKGTVPVAFVVPRVGYADNEALRAELSQAIVDAVGAIARPARVIVVSTVPRTRSGKVMRRVLRDLLLSGQASGDLTSLDNPDAIDVVIASLRSS